MATDPWVIIAARNEADRLPATVAALRGRYPDARVVVADDGSSDATADAARAAGADVVRSARNVGKGPAATLAARRALDDPAAEDSDLVLLCDADLGGSAAALTRLVDAVERGEGDLAVAAFARRVGGGFGLALGAARWAIHRRTGLEPGAPLSGQRAMRLAVLRAVVPFARGFGMEVGMTIDAARAGHRLVEVELDLEHRATGRTARGFLHRGKQLLDVARVYFSRR